ncbi:hypothetical protein [Streptomyces sp. NPDC058385]|uniref:hypothetical protein n=1 Tax=Streptomyces sp. NPDC058385 TaxID=3346473 RepID=UPI00364E29EF
MGRTKPNKPRHKLQDLHKVRQRRSAPDADQSTDAGAAAEARISWTPLEQSCGCVAEWGWESQTADPATFMEWTMTRPAALCPWHAETLTGAEGKDMPERLAVLPHGTGVLLHVRRAAADRHELGRELAQRLTALLALVGEGEKAVLENIPAGYRGWLTQNTPQPAQAWFEQQLMDILLNQGRSALPSEVLESMPWPAVQAEAEPTAGQDGTADSEEICRICADSNEWDGIRCSCGHDWICHPGGLGNEPCAHCACTNMQVIPN